MTPRLNEAGVPRKHNEKMIFSELEVAFVDPKRGKYIPDVKEHPALLKNGVRFLDH